MSRILLTLAGSALFIVVLSGCGPGGPATQQVTGKVTVGGEPATGLTITFSPVATDGTVASGTVEADGTYTLYTGAQGTPGAVAGKYKIVLSDPSSGPMGGEGDVPDYMDSGTDPTKAAAEEEGKFPTEYGSAETSPKEVEVVAGANTINVEI